MTKVQLLYSRHNNYFIPGAHNSTYWAKNHDQPCDHQYVQTSDSSEEEIVMLTESDVPGASLNGKQPHELNVPQLKRWLACRGAPVTGKSQTLLKGKVSCVWQYHTLAYIYFTTNKAITIAALQPSTIIICSICLAYRVNYYMKYGWDQYLVDPDRGVNCQKKLTAGVIVICLA